MAPDSSIVRRSLVLNVNDSVGPLAHVNEILQNAGFEVLEARSGAKALEIVESHRPDLLVLDIRLPDLDGFEVCRRIKQNPASATTKVLHTSATYVSIDSKVQSLVGGADAYLSQPFEAEELIATVQALLRLRRTERELEAVAEKLREADRRKDEFLAMLAHELRNPLAAISSSLPIVLRRPSLDATEQHARDVLTRQTQHLARLVDDLLDVGRVTQGKIELKREPLRLCSLLESAVANAHQTRTGARQQTLELVLPSEPVYVDADATRLEQVFNNLLDNASKYTPSGGRLEVRLEHIGGAAGDRVRVTVRDNGAGIARDMLSSIFGLFSQGDVPIARSLGGLGVGLTLVRTLVELHGGSVSASSPGPGQGSELEVILPRCAEPAALPLTAAASQGTRGSHKRRVLLVDDNSDTLEVLSELLSLWGHEVDAAADGLTAVSKALSMLPDVAFIDIGLPGIDGYEVARRIRADPKGKQLRLIALTGYGAPEQRAEAVSAGFDLHLVKPVQPDGLRPLLEASARRDAK